MTNELLMGFIGVMIGSILTFLINWIILKRQKQLEAYGNINKNLAKFFGEINKLAVNKKFTIENIGDKESKKLFYNSLNELRLEIYSNFYILPQDICQKLLKIIDDIYNEINLQFDTQKILKKIDIFSNILESNSKKWINFKFKSS